MSSRRFVLSHHEVSASIVLLIALNLLAHFLPFERASVANDDYAFSFQSKQLTSSQIMSLTPRQPNRPGAFLLLMVQGRVLGDNAQLGLLVMLVMSSAVVVAVFFLLKLLCQQTVVALLGSAMFVLVPNKLEVYHLPVCIFMDVANLLYLGSFLLAIMAVRQQRRLFLALSLLCYSAAILIYEPGFFLPGIVLLYLVGYDRSQWKIALYYLIPASLYLAFRLTGAFGFADPTPVHTHTPDLRALPRNLVDFFHHYGGRYMIRNLLYGVYQYPRLEPVWLGLISLANVTLLIAAAKWLKRVSLPPIDRRLVAIGAGVFVLCSLPSLLNSQGGIGGRQLVLPSIGLAVLLLWLLGLLRRQWRLAFVPAATLMLVACQGNAWSQVMACRITGAVYETIKAHRDELRQAERVVIDTKSFAERIPFTWVPRDFNVLNTYYGAQTFEAWGLQSMVRLVTENPQVVVYMATERPRPLEHAFEVTVSAEAGYRQVQKVTHTIPAAGTVMIDFEDVYGRGFYRGKRQAGKTAGNWRSSLASSQGGSLTDTMMDVSR